VKKVISNALVRVGLREPDIEVTALSPLPEFKGDGSVKGRSVQLWRPPVQLSLDGKTQHGVSRELIAGYLVAVTAALAQTDLGEVTVEWQKQVGRFVTVRLDIRSWGQSITVMHPIAIVTQDIANVFDMYAAGIAWKVRELHKGHQRLDQANQMIRRAMSKLEKLRDDDRPHVNDAEYLFVMTQFQKALALSALIPVADAPPEDVFHSEHVVIWD
jgi:hypothetical protein